MQIILLSGKQGSGKTTTALAVEKKFRDAGLLLMRYRFATALYAAHDAVIATLSRLGAIPATQKDGLLLQVLGTEWGRKRDTDMWVNAARAYYAKLETNTQDTGAQLVGLIEDCRFFNEFHSYPDTHAIRVRLEASEETRKARTESWRENTSHPSETELDDYAADGKFDLCFDTSTVPTDIIACKILTLYNEKVACGKSSSN